MKQIPLLINGVTGKIGCQADPLNLKYPLQVELKRTPLCGTTSAQPTDHDTSLFRDVLIFSLPLETMSSLKTQPNQSASSSAKIATCHQAAASSWQMFERTAQYLF